MPRTFRSSSWTGRSTPIALSSFIGSANVTIGKLAVAGAAKLLANGGNVVELRGLTSFQAQIERDKGFRDGIAGNPKIKIIANRDCKWLTEPATVAIEQWLAEYPKIDLVYGQNDRWRLGAATFIYPTSAKEAADEAEAIVHHQPVKHHLTLGTTEVTAANVAALYKQYEFAQTASQVRTRLDGGRSTSPAVKNVPRWIRRVEPT